MPISNFPKGFNGGVSIQGMPISMLFATSQSALTSTGKSGVFWVDSNYGVDGGAGSYQRPLATLGRALALASQNDVIIMKPYHAESISSATAASGAWNVAGVSIVGLGVGVQRPNITLDTATTATVNISAANISVQNVIFTANVQNVAVLFTLTTAKGFACDNCLIQDTSSVLNFLKITSTNTTANAADKLSITNNKFLLLATTGAVQIYVPGAAEDQVNIVGNTWITPTTGTGAAIALGANAHTNFLLRSNDFVMTNASATATAIVLTGSSNASTGFIDKNQAFSLANGGGTTNLLFTTGTGIRFGFNYTSDTADTSMYLLPAADS